ncbi:hypothetical protein MKZ23_11145 [Paenibacillus sp. FSL R5-0876]|uniref:hypothetical protein n=1 Tax=Paenibacillus sp. FSL R5-0876 TaxID=2921661 RepID=UPI0030F73A0F
MQLGQYRFTNDTLISVHNKNEEMDNVMKHEFIHRLLSGASTYGVLLIMMEKASIMDDQKKWLFDELLNISNKMQEQVATFIEYFEIIRKDGIEIFKEKIKQLQLYNKKYFNYFNFIYQYIKKESFSEEFVNKTIEMVISIGINSLNVDLYKLPFASWENKKDIQRFFTNSENNLKFNPNKRFEVLIKYFFNQKSINNELNIIAENTFFNEEERLEACISAMELIYYKSAQIEIIMNRISNFSDLELELDNEASIRLTAFPSFNRTEETFESNYKKLPDIINELRLDNESILNFNHLLRGLEGIALLMYVPLNRNEDFVCQYHPSDIISIIKEVTNSIVFSQGKLYRSIKNDLLKELDGRKIYIFMENSFTSSFSLISNEFSSSRYILIPEQEYDIVAINNNNHILLQLVLKGLKNDIYEQLKTVGIQKANFIEGLQFNYQEIIKVTRALFNRCNWAINSKSFGFK